MSLRGILSGLVALARRGKAKPLVHEGPFASVTMGSGGRIDLGEVVIAQPAQPRPPTPGEMAEGKRP